uniref:Uncharacterized protein n=1 Tax=Chromera velia CCMP2878 TaxID=1169474 RepID=A0A0G4IA90_9ALVE|eukprot:Cvel_2076.t1-p1 / transcript=Cvel_2076.t1 / gene=Cvel_2076 / organism=Chromera_velia_CCMP2878 / gene_product=hypothetical protein / transcript_product=hypothetical protein / location=Cvel_scaffold80:60540-69416(+) / protein_length=1157 / sequence_SO=supercontig / SO=protein_coding / is_pseudo=false
MLVVERFGNFVLLLEALDRFKNIPILYVQKNGQALLAEGRILAENLVEAVGGSSTAAPSEKRNPQSPSRRSPTDTEGILKKSKTLSSEKLTAGAWAHKQANGLLDGSTKKQKTPSGGGGSNNSPLSASQRLQMDVKRERNPHRRSDWRPVRLFWKLLRVNKAFRSRKDDPTLFGLGGAVSSLSLLAEREHLRKLVADCIRRDDTDSLKKLQAVANIFERIPGLYSRALEFGSEESVRLLGRHPARPPSRSEFTLEGIRKMTRGLMEELLAGGELNPNLWVERSFTFQKHARNEVHNVTAKCFHPLLTVVLSLGKFDCAELLLDRSARVDVCECAADEESAFAIETQKRTEFETPEAARFFTFTSAEGSHSSGMTALHRLVWMLSSPLPSKTGGGGESGGVSAKETAAENRSKCLALLSRVVQLAREARSLDWMCRWYPEGWRRGGGGAMSTGGGSDRGPQAALNNQSQTSALGIACFYRDVEVAGVLLSEGARLNWPPSSDWRGVGGQVEPPLLMALQGEVGGERGDRGSEKAQEDEKEIGKAVSMLRERGASLVQVGVDRRTAVGLACVRYLQSVVESLLAFGAPVGQVNGVCARTPLAECLQAQKWNFARLLLSKGACPNEPSLLPKESENCPAEDVAQNFLPLQHEGSSLPLSRPVFVSPVQVLVWTLANKARQMQRYEAQGMEAGREERAKDSSQGIDVLKEMLDAGAVCDLQHASSDSVSASAAAASGGIPPSPPPRIFVPVSRYRLSSFSPLSAACFQKCSEIVSLLLQGGRADPNRVGIFNMGGSDRQRQRKVRPLSAAVAAVEFQAAPNPDRFAQSHGRLRGFGPGEFEKRAKFILGTWEGVMKPLMQAGATLTLTLGDSQRIRKKREGDELSHVSLSDSESSSSDSEIMSLSRLRQVPFGRRWGVPRKARVWLPQLMRHIDEEKREDRDLLLRLIRMLPFNTLKAASVESFSASPLLVACRIGWTDCVAALIERGIPVNRRSRVNGESALLAALRSRREDCESPHWDCVDLLLKGGASLQIDGGEALRHAVEAESERWVSCFIEKGASVLRKVPTKKLSKDAESDPDSDEQSRGRRVDRDSEESKEDDRKKSTLIDSPLDYARRKWESEDYKDKDVFLSLLKRLTLRSEQEKELIRESEREREGKASA